MIYGAPKASTANPSLQSAAALTGLEGRLISLGSGFGAVAGCQMHRWSAVPTADAGFLGTSTGTLAILTFRCAARGAVSLLVFGTDGEYDEGGLTGVPAAKISNTGRTGGSGVLAQHAWPLVDAGPAVP